MRKTVHEKFKHKINFVKPLYRQSGNIFKRVIPYDSDNRDLRGDAKCISNVITVKGKNKEVKVVLPGACDSDISIRDTHNVTNSDISLLMSKVEDRTHASRSVRTMKSAMGDKIKKTEGIKSDAKIVMHKMPESWLRVYPAPKVAGETTCPVIIRCVVCQLGLTTFLILWTIIGVFVIQSFEGPQETKISKEFEKDQNQLVIDLATELRQITPLSSKWKSAIERRIEDERRLTMAAVSQGAKLKSGTFWNLSGTFLFAVYVMTALGFGAPVPHTIWGRTAASIYAILAIPTHIYLMLNGSTCVVINAEMYLQSLKPRVKRKFLFNTTKSNVQVVNESPNCSRHSEAEKPPKRSFVRESAKGCLKLYGVGRGLPFIVFLYYTLGLVIFGVLRNKNMLETIMFPLEFTTTGGLEHVESYARVLYGLYLEGAVCLLACTLATLRRYSGTTITEVTRNYRLFVSERCVECENEAIKR